MSSKSRRDFFLGLAVPLTMAVSACQPASSDAEKVADKFIDQYYVKIDLQNTIPMSDDLAKEKLEHQLKLMQDAGPATASVKPMVNYNLVSKTPEANGEASFIYQVKVDSKEINPRRVFVKVRQENGVWKVTQFSEAVEDTQ